MLCGVCIIEESFPLATFEYLGRLFSWSLVSVTVSLSEKVQASYSLGGGISEFRLGCQEVQPAVNDRLLQHLRQRKFSGGMVPAG